MIRRILFILFTLLTAGSALAEKTDVPEITGYVQNVDIGLNRCHIEVSGKGELMAYLDGVPYNDEAIGSFNYMDYGYVVYENDDDDYTRIEIEFELHERKTIVVTATAQQEGKEMSDVAVATIEIEKPAIVWGAYIYADGIDSERGLQVHITSDPSYGYDFLFGEMVLDGFKYQINDSGEWLQYDENSSTIYLSEYGDYVISAYGYAAGHGSSATATAWIHYDEEGYTSYSKPRDDYYQYLVHNDVLYDILSDSTVRVSSREIPASSPSFELPHAHHGDIVIPSSFVWEGKTYTVVAIGNNAFNDVLYEGGSTSLSSIVIPNTVTTIGDYAFQMCAALTGIELPSSLVSIGIGAFRDCTGFTSIEIPGSVNTIGSWAFSGCKGLTIVTIPSSVTRIGNDAFRECSGLTTLAVESGNTVYDSRDNCNAIIETASNKLLVGCMNTVIPNTVTAIGDDAFQRCVGLTNIVIPNSVTTIGNGAFEDCNMLTSVTIPNSVTSIGRNAFEDCDLLTSVAIPNSVISIGSYAFAFCDKVTNVSIGESVTSIGGYAFHLCAELTSMVCHSATPPAVNGNLVSSYNDAAFYERATLYVPNESLEAYRAHQEWGKFSRIVPFIGTGPGDVNGDGSVSVGDATNLIDELLSGGDLPAWMDVNGDGNVSIGDVTALIDMLLSSN